MGEIPGWIREQLRNAGWVVVESLETFDVHLGDRYANRAMALQKALTGDALLASSGKASVSSDLEGEFFVGRLRRSAEPIAAEDERLLVYSLDLVERHVRPSREVDRSQPAPAGERKTRAWKCPACEQTWQIIEEEPDIPEERARCPECGEQPSEFAPGQVVRVRQVHGSRTRLGIVDEPVKAGCLLPGEHVVSDVGPFTGEYMVLHLSEAYGSRAPADPEFECTVFGNLPLDPTRRRALAVQLMTATSAAPEQIQALEPEEEGHLSGT